MIFFSPFSSSPRYYKIYYSVVTFSYWGFVKSYILFCPLVKIRSSLDGSFPCLNLAFSLTHWVRILSIAISNIMFPHDSSPPFVVHFSQHTSLQLKSPIKINSLPSLSIFSKQIFVLSSFLLYSKLSHAFVLGGIWVITKYNIYQHNLCVCAFVYLPR